MIKCRTCNRKLAWKGETLPDGICQIGQGSTKPILTFCNEKCQDIYEKHKEKKQLWKLKGTPPKKCVLVGEGVADE